MKLAKQSDVAMKFGSDTYNCCDIWGHVNFGGGAAMFGGHFAENESLNLKKQKETLCQLGSRLSMPSFKKIGQNLKEEIDFEAFG